MKFKFLFISAMLFFVSGIIFAEKSILYINDNTHVSNYFNIKYIDMLQSLIDDDLGKNNVNVNNFSMFDMNTSQCLEVFDNIYSKNHQDAIVLMIGDSNYHNLYGFSKYIKSRYLNEPVEIKAPRNIYEINSEMLKLYAGTDKNTLTKVVGVVCNTLVGTGQNQK